jgi:dTDP-4-dehydrorhamnose 3,5-epimerase
MPVQVEETAIPDIKIIRASRFHDDRGFFTETYKESEYLDLGIPKFVQDNMSESSKGVIRGLHWQDIPFGQGKLVSCLSGSILDVAVDIRPESPTYGQHVMVKLHEKEQVSLWIPEGFAHGFQALEDSTRVHYKVTNYWAMKFERSINFASPDLNISWNDNLKVLVSEKDLSAPLFYR